MDTQFKVPTAKCMSGTKIVVLVNDPKTDPRKQFGQLRSLSPDEVRHALILAVARDIEKNLPQEDWIRRPGLTSACSLACCF